jgi:acetyltransferase
MLEKNTFENARRHRIRLLGPNCLGVLRPELGLNASFADGGAIKGSIGLISQSGALCSAILDWARPNNVGFSSVVSLGTSVDIDFGEVLEYMVSDSRTESIFLYVEGIKDARRFVSALRAAARVKPVLLIKVGRHPAGSQAALLHSGAMVGEDAVFDAALRRAGVIRLYTLGQLFAAANALFSHFRPRGNRLAVITNGGGSGVMAADRAADLRIPLAQLSDGTVAKLNEILPANWSHCNPVDIIGDADPERYAKTLEIVLADENVEGVLTILTPQAMTRPTEVAQKIIDIERAADKPVFTCWMGEEQVREGRKLFEAAGIPTFRTTEPAVELFGHISAYYRNQKLLVQTPSSLSLRSQPAVRRERPAGDRDSPLRAPQEPQRDGVQGPAGRFPHSHCTDRGGPFGHGGHGAGRGTRPAGGHEDRLPVHHPQGRAGWRAPEPARSGRRAQRLPGDPGRGEEEAPRRHHQRRRHRADDPQALWPRTDGRRVPRPGLRPGDHLR